jgi:branched-chain amino acid transport system permease protein
MTPFEVFLQQVITGLSNGMIIALIALGYTMVYGIVELINFAHGDLFTLGSFFALTMIGVFGVIAPSQGNAYGAVLVLILASGIFCAVINWLVDALAYRPLRKSPRLAPLVSAIGVSFIFLNIALFWGGLPMKVFSGGQAPAAPKDFPNLFSADNLFGDSAIYFTSRELFVFAVTIPLLIGLNILIRKTKMGKAMRAVAQNPNAALLMGVNVDRVIGHTFLIGGALAGVASVVYALYNNTIYFQMGYRVGMDAFTAAVLGGIGSISGAVLGGILIGILRAMSDGYIATSWTNVVVFVTLVVLLVFRPSGLLGATAREKV